MIINQHDFQVGIVDILNLKLWWIGNSNSIQVAMGIEQNVAQNKRSS